MTAETDLKHQIKDYLDMLGIFNFYLLAGMGAYKGSPDRIALIKTEKCCIMVCIEIKAKKGELSEHQEKFKYNIENNNGCYLVVRSLEDLIDGIKNYKKLFNL